MPFSRFLALGIFLNLPSSDLEYFLICPPHSFCRQSLRQRDHSEGRLLKNYNIMCPERCFSYVSVMICTLGYEIWSKAKKKKLAVSNSQKDLVLLDECESKNNCETYILQIRSNTLIDEVFRLVWSFLAKLIF